MLKKLLYSLLKPLYLLLEPLTYKVFPALGVGLIIFTFIFGIVEVAKPDLEEPLVPYANKANVVLTKYLPTLEIPYLKWNDEWSKGKFPRKLIGE